MTQQEKETKVFPQIRVLAAKFESDSHKVETLEDIANLESKLNSILVISLCKYIRVRHSDTQLVSEDLNLEYLAGTAEILGFEYSGIKDREMLVRFGNQLKNGSVSNVILASGLVQAFVDSVERQLQSKCEETNLF